MRIKKEGNEDQPLFPISVVAQMLEVHPQTLRLYEREGLISPGRTKGKIRLYSYKDVEQLKTILYFTQDLGINLAGVDLLLRMQLKINELEEEMQRALEHWRSGLETRKIGRQGSDAPSRPAPPKTIKIKIEEG